MIYTHLLSSPKVILKNSVASLFKNKMSPKEAKGYFSFLVLKQIIVRKDCANGPLPKLNYT